MTVENYIKIVQTNQEYAANDNNCPGMSCQFICHVIVKKVGDETEVFVCNAMEWPAILALCLTISALQLAPVRSGRPL